MKILQLLPQLDLGGVERHVIDLSNQLVSRGHQVLVVSAGGQMESQMDPRVQLRHLAVHRKNPLTGYRCSLAIARWIRKEGWQLIHAHSRVPAWIALWASRRAKVPYLVTAHVDFGNKSPWIYRPYREAARVICVSFAVQEAMKGCFSDNTTVVINGLDEPKACWDPQNLQGPVKFLFAGRLSPVKGLQDLLRALPAELLWTLDVVGDGPMRLELEALARDQGIADRVVFHGYCDDVDPFMAQASCLLFPSYNEGFGLVLARAVQMGLPVIASDIAPVAEVACSRQGLLPPGDLEAWRKALVDFLNRRRAVACFDRTKVPRLEDMVDRNLEIYRSLQDGSGQEALEMRP